MLIQALPAFLSNSYVLEIIEHDLIVSTHPESTPAPRPDVDDKSISFVEISWWGHELLSFAGEYGKVGDTVLVVLLIWFQFVVFEGFFARFLADVKQSWNGELGNRLVDDESRCKGFFPNLQAKFDGNFRE